MPFMNAKRTILENWKDVSTPTPHTQLMDWRTQSSLLQMITRDDNYKWRHLWIFGSLSWMYAWRVWNIQCKNNVGKREDTSSLEKVGWFSRSKTFGSNEIRKWNVSTPTPGESGSASHRRGEGYSAFPLLVSGLLEHFCPCGAHPSMWGGFSWDPNVPEQWNASLGSWPVLEVLGRHQVLMFHLVF